MYRKCKCNKPDCNLTYKVNNCEFSKIWILFIHEMHPESSPVNDSSVNARAKGKTHKRYGIALRVQNIYQNWLKKDQNLTAQQLLSKLIDRRKTEIENKKKKEKKILDLDVPILTQILKVLIDRLSDLLKEKKC